MFYFGAFWPGKGGAFNRFACSYDLVHWTDWTGPDLISSSEPYDEVFAHKSFVVKYKGVVYHYYCGVDKKGNRGIAVATSVDKGKSELGFEPRVVAGRSNFDAGWKFHLGDDSAFAAPGYDASGWRTVDLPHDWSIEGDFSASNSTGQGEGGLPAGVGWYRKMFRVPEYKHVFVDFDGVYRNCEVWVNGHYVGKRPNGYISFRYDIDKWMNRKGDNVIAVRVDNSQQPNSRWYTGSGIYRHVWLEMLGPTAVDQWGIQVTTPKIVGQRVAVSVVTRFRATSFADYALDCKTTIYDAEGRKVDEEKGSHVFGDSLRTIQQYFVIPAAEFWSPEHPYLYRAVVDIDGQRYETKFGVRSFRFDAKKGFVLNGKSLKIQGVCLHHDLGALGAAVNTAAMRRQLKLLKEMGCNAIRTSHNPPAPEFLDLCDSIGFLVMDEAFDMWRKKKNKYDYSLDFGEWSERDLRDQVMRDRNHPSVFMWSIGNEIREQFDSSGIGIARRLAGIVRELDSTRPVTSALTETDTMKNFIYRSGVLDVMGLNYNHEKYDSVPLKYPGQAFIASETTSALETRGHYDGPADSLRRWPPSAKEPVVGGNADWTVSAYDNVYAYWGSTHEATWKAAKRCPWVSGVFVWTGFDYIGEPTPYPWPARSSYFGIFDLAGFPKDIYYMYRSEWTAKPVLHILPHWNWKAGDWVDVWAYYSQADEVELFLNGRSLGVRRKVGDDLHVSWKVRWEAGELKAVSRKGGKVVLSDVVRTAGAAAKVVLSVDRSRIAADGVDLAFVTVKVVDAAGRVVPGAGNELEVKVEGEGELAGMDNGYQAGMESFRGSRHKAFNGLCLAIIRAKKKAGKILVRVGGQGLLPATTEIVVR
ncbi:MAG: DUF4982 domain-containing protein [Bacteroidetes bacterium]|nr:DUF4982 domain-containing protein [Bacteroidota bacterium]